MSHRERSGSTNFSSLLSCSLGLSSLRPLSCLSRVRSQICRPKLPSWATRHESERCRLYDRANFKAYRKGAAMKRRHHVEITTFRRRTTIVYRDKSKAGGGVGSNGDDDALPQKPDELVRYPKPSSSAPIQNKGEITMKTKKKIGMTVIVFALSFAFLPLGHSTSADRKSVV